MDGSRWVNGLVCDLKITFVLFLCDFYFGSQEGKVKFT